jgi:O-antigen biosynthesis protein
MVRPASVHRAPRLTMEVLRTVARRYGDRVEIRLFGADPLEQGFLSLPHDFEWRLAGAINQRQMAMFLNDADVFVDFSTFQALGITAQEAMSSGAAVIVPTAGGASTFAKHEHNCLMVDSSSAEACTSALARLVEDHELRQRIQRTGTHEVCAYHPELPTYNILKALFGEH